MDVADQLVVFAGRRLESSETLGAHELPTAAEPPPPPPVDDDAATTPHPKPSHVFMYMKSLLRTEATAPPVPPMVAVAVEASPPPPPPPPPATTAAAADHPLDASPSPLARALPDYERDFRAHAQRASSFARAMRRRFEHCERLILETHAMALAVDAVAENVDAHFSYIARRQVRSIHWFPYDRVGVVNVIP